MSLQLLPLTGCCFLFGGLYFPEQSFNPQANKASCSLLFLAAIAITVPTAATMLFPSGLSTDAMLHISHGTCIMLIIVYVAFLTSSWRHRTTIPTYFCVYLCGCIHVS